MSQQTRREFLERSMLATAAGVAFGPVLNPGPTFAEESSSPNERLRVAILGVNGRGQSHIGGFGKRKDCEIAAIVDPDETIGQSRAEGIEKNYGKKPTVFKDMRKAFDDDSIDIVSIATPNHWHSLAAIWAIQSGKDVYVEKPVSHNVSEGRRVVQAARKYNKMVQTGTQIRSQPGVIEAIKFLQEGGIGNLTVARGLCYKSRGSIGPKGNYDVPAGIDYNLWLGPAPEKPLTRPRLHYDWHWVWDTGNGDLGNQGIHQMDIARWGLGVSDLGDSVVSYGGRLGYEDAGETANTQVSIHNYGKQRLVFEVRGLKTQPYLGAGVGVIFHGSDGYLVINSYDGGAAFDLDGNKTKEFKGGSDHFDNFITAVRSRKISDLNADIEQGHLSSALCHLGNVSYRLGQQTSAKEVEKRLDGDDEAMKTFERATTHLTANGIDLAETKLGFGAQLSLDGKKEVFTGEMAETANPWLTREYRKPFVVPSQADV